MIASAISRTTSLQTVTLNCQARCSVKPCGEERNLSKDGCSMTSCSPRPFAAAAIQILVEKRGDVEFVEGIGGLGLRNFFGFGFQEGFVAVVLSAVTLSSVNSSSTGFATIS